ncbi:Protein-tyrosine phosphatase [Necator americanus]|uniref:Protein-tyrosine phosphatase n=1 Tax=Necator americanus TaxID=51031 RepID=W2U0C7_NECAM|nr:Protein-tyrosine phosphatase [Necator americanus]ETN86776.1 Protein-tyrosine phosphatase [Necator americanus]
MVGLARPRSTAGSAYQYGMILRRFVIPVARITKCISKELLSRIRGTKKPIIVHCSAGIGRTGTIVAIEYILERMQAGVECATMCDLLKELRNQRAYTIQNDLVSLLLSEHFQNAHFHF